MENQATPVIQNNSSTEQIPIIPQASHTQSKSNFLPIVLATLVSGVIFGASGYYLGKQPALSQNDVNNEQNQVLSTENPQVDELVPTLNVSPTPDPTANWETYTNSENGYSIKFPKTDYTRLGCIGEELTAEKYGISNRPSPMAMIACERDGRYNLETKTYPSIQSEPEETKYYDIIKKDVQIGGTTGKLYIHTFTEVEEGPYPKWFAIARVNKNNKTYEIYFSDKEKLDLFTQILSTFKFTN